MMHLNVAEVFDSVQGEGIYLGTKQVFVRLSGCNLACSYCDTSWAWENQQKFKVSLLDREEILENPCEPQKLANLVLKFLPKNTFAISITGGEPLKQADALIDFLKILDNKTKILLETNGTLHNELTKLLPFIDIVSMDIKLSEFVDRDYSEEHIIFLQKAKGKKLYVKIVLSDNANENELVRIAEYISQVSPDIPLILQPLAQISGNYEIKINQLVNIQNLLLNILHDVRIIPQMHKLLGIR